VYNEPPVQKKLYVSYGVWLYFTDRRSQIRVVAFGVDSVTFLIGAPPVVKEVNEKCPRTYNGIYILRVFYELRINKAGKLVLR
jgi:hypothetical protein